MRPGAGGNAIQSGVVEGLLRTGNHAYGTMSIHAAITGLGVPALVVQIGCGLVEDVDSPLRGEAGIGCELKTEHAGNIRRRHRGAAQVSVAGIRIVVCAVNPVTRGADVLVRSAFRLRGGAVIRIS